MTLLETLPRIVPLEDEDISAELLKQLKKRGMKIELEAKVESVKKNPNGAAVTFKDKAGKSQTISAEKVLIAVGRRPLTENLGLEKTKIKLDRGYIVASPYLETDEPNVYAIGDIVAGLPQLAHAASQEGLIAVARMAGKDTQPFDRRRCPNATYCEPQVGSIGLTEKQARRCRVENQDWKISVRGQQQSVHTRTSRRIHQSGRRREVWRDSGRARDRRAGHGNHRRAGTRRWDSRQPRRHGRNDPRASPQCGEAMGDAFNSVARADH